MFCLSSRSPVEWKMMVVSWFWVTIGCVVCSFLVEYSRKCSELLVLLTWIQHAGAGEAGCVQHYPYQLEPLSLSLFTSKMQMWVCHRLWPRGVCLKKHTPVWVLFFFIKVPNWLLKKEWKKAITWNKPSSLFITWGAEVKKLHKNIAQLYCLGHFSVVLVLTFACWSFSRLLYRVT